MARKTSKTQPQPTHLDNVKSFAQDKYARAREAAMSEPVVSAAKFTGAAVGGAAVLGVAYSVFATTANKIFAALN